MRVFTDNPGSPNIQAGLSKYPLATTVGGTAGIEHDFNRLQVSVAGLADRTTYQSRNSPTVRLSTMTTATSTSSAGSRASATT
jgi:hypothetical protein